MLIVEPEPALAEIRRVLTNDGVFVAAVWGGPQDNPWLTSVGMAAMMHGLVQGGPPVGPGGPFSLADPVDLEKRMRGAGFADVEVQVVEAVRCFASADEHFETVGALAPPLAAALGAASDEQHAAVRETVGSLTVQYRDGEGLRLPMRALICIAHP
jgi:SAM-dependent methyltransferase